MVGLWTLEERPLIGELAVGMARRLEHILPKTRDNDPVGPGYIWHGAQSAFETACSVLWRLGAAHGKDLPDSRRSKLKRRNQEMGETIVEQSGFPPFFKFLPASEIRALLAGTWPPESLVRETSRPIPSRDEVLPAYLGVACDYGADHSWLSSSREQFIPQEEYAQEVEAMVSLGYMERRGLAVIWTDKITLAMYEAYIWMDEEPPPDALEDAWNSAQDEVKSVLETMPQDVKTLLAREAKRLSGIDFTAFLRDQFAEIYWRKNPDGTPRPSSSQHLSRHVYRFLRTL